MKNTNELFLSCSRKANLLYLDYTLSCDPVEKDAILEMLSTYIYKMDDPKLIFIYSKICETYDNDTEHENYIEIMGDLLSNISEES